MLCQFTVKNFRSIKDEVTLDMQATSIKENVEHLIRGVDNQTFLPVSVIYGPNGGGKSNVLTAIKMLQMKILRPIFAAISNTEYNAKTVISVIEPFAFDKNKKSEPTEFEVYFRTELAEYRYGIVILKETVIDEYLDRIKFSTGRRSSLFSRNEEGIELKGDFAKLKISEDISETLPLLSFLAITYSKNEIVQDVLNWFINDLFILNYGNPFNELKVYKDQYLSLKELILKMMIEMDLSIVDFRFIEKDSNRIDIITKHKVDDDEFELLFDYESNGTKKIFGLLPFVAKSLMDGTTMVIDELDANMHPRLLGYLIKLYSDKSSNTKGAQLIFTSHDLSTMNSEYFRRDEVWFVAKGNQENSKLYSLVEFKSEDGKSVRKDARFDKQYLEGKFGADPYLRKIIEWGDFDAK